MPNFSLSHKRVKVLARMAGPCRRQASTRAPANAPRSGPRTAGFCNEIAIRHGRARERKRSGQGANRSRVMKLFTGWMVAAGLALAATAAQAQVPATEGAGRPSYTAVSDVGGAAPGPYAAMPPEAPRPGYGSGPTLLPPIEVYTVV